MSEWKITRVSQMAEILSGGTPKTEVEEYWNGNIPWLSVKDFAGDTRKVYDSEKHISELGLNSSATQLLYPGDLIISARGTVGEIAQIGKTSAFNQSCYGLRVADGYSSDYLYYMLKYQVRYLKSVANGAVFDTIVVKTFDRMKASVPDLPTQKRIADILSTYDDLIENNNRRIALLEKAAQELYKEWFVRFRFPGYTTIKFESGLPLGWEFRSVEDISAVLQRGISPIYADDGESWVINQKCIRKSIMDISEARKQTKAFKPILNLQDGDTVICSTGTGTLGRVGQVYGDYPHTTFDSHVTMVRAKEGVGKYFLYYSLKNLQPWFMSMGIGSTNQQELYRKTIKNAKVVVPDIGVMNMFEEHISTIHNQIILLSKSTECATKQRDMLLPRLMSGKLEV